MKSKVDIKKMYPEFEEFFTRCLQIKAADRDILIKELLLIVQEYEGKPLDDVLEKLIRKFLRGICVQVKERSSDDFKLLERIFNEPIFLVKYRTDDQPVLRRRTDDFFVQDFPDLFDIFSVEDIPFLDYSPEDIQFHEPLLQLFGPLKKISDNITQTTHVAKGGEEDKSATALLSSRQSYIIR